MMTRIVTIVFFVVTCWMSAGAQDSAPRIEEPSSREQALRFLQEKLSALGAVKWTETRHKDKQELINARSQQVSSAVADANTCKLTFTVSTYTKGITCPADGCGDPRRGFAVHGLSLAEIGNVSTQPLQYQAATNETTTIAPGIFQLVVEMNKGSLIQSCVGSAPSWHRVDCTPSRWTSLSIDFQDEETASELAAALRHAGELCRKAGE
jgi:hypothetical protein